MRHALVALAALGLALAGPAGLAHAAVRPAIPPGQIYYSSCVTNGGTAVWYSDLGYYVCVGGEFDGRRIGGVVPVN